MWDNSRNFIWPVLLVIAFSCYPPPEIPVIPHIEFRSLRYVDTPDDIVPKPGEGRPPDSLILKFYFEDGDGDLGLTSSEVYPPVHPFDYVIDSKDSVVTISSTVVPPLYLVTPGYSGRRLLSESDVRPPFNCEDYYYEDINGVSSDTFFIQKNEYYNNIHLTFYRKVFGVYNEIDLAPAGSGCPIDFDARIPVFEEENVISQRPINGTISYVMESNGFKYFFGNDTFKIEFYIYDRGLNKSNVATSPDLRLLNTN